MTMRHLPLPMLLACCAATALTAPAAAQSEQLNPVRLNQIGFLPSGPKRAVVPDASKKPLAWRLVDSSGRTQAKGMTSVFGPDKASGDHVHLVDFGSFKGTGRGYRLVLGTASSRAFPVSPTVYDRLPYDALSYFYHNRAGTPIEARFAGGEQWARPIAHSPETATCVSGIDSKGNKWPGSTFTSGSKRRGAPPPSPTARRSCPRQATA
jgi:endoglucanase